MKKISQSIKVILLAIVLSFGISYVFAWTAPTVAPTGGNSTAPLNTSSNIQTKNGNLLLNALGITNTALGALNVAGGAVFGSNGTMSPNALLTLYGGDILLKQNVVTGNTGANNIGFAIDTGASTGAAASMGILKETVNGASSLVFKNWNGSNTVETARIASNGNLTATGVICDSTGCIGGATASHGKQRFTSSGTFTVPVGVTKVWVSMSGGGGGGAGPGQNGGNGGSSTFGVYVTTPGGFGAAGGVGGASGGAGGQAGQYGEGGDNNGGDGGGTIFGSGGFGGNGNTSSTGTVTGYLYGRIGGGYGSGGGGYTGVYGGGGGATTIIAQEVIVTSGETIAITVGAGGSSHPIAAGPGAPGFVLVEW